MHGDPVGVVYSTGAGQSGGTPAGRGAIGRDWVIVVHNKRTSRRRDVGDRLMSARGSWLTLGAMTDRIKALYSFYR